MAWYSTGHHSINSACIAEQCARGSCMIMPLMHVSFMLANKGPSCWMCHWSTTSHDRYLTVASGQGKPSCVLCLVNVDIMLPNIVHLTIALYILTGKTGTLSWSIVTKLFCRRCKPELHRNSACPSHCSWLHNIPHYSSSECRLQGPSISCRLSCLQVIVLH